MVQFSTARQVVQFCSGVYNSPPAASLEASTLEYGPDCQEPEFSWRVNGQPIMSNSDYSNEEFIPFEELLSFLTSGKDEYINFSLDWPLWGENLDCSSYVLAGVAGYSGSYGRKSGMLSTEDTYGFDLAGHEITDLQVDDSLVDHYSWYECWGWWGPCFDYYYYEYEITLEIYGIFMPFLAGSGTEEDPYQIWTAEEMNEIGKYAVYWDKHFILMADIDLSGFDGNEGRPDFNIIAPDTDAATSGFQGVPFIGVFDGNGHTISNFNYSSTEKDYTGIFGRIDGDNAEIRNLGLINPNVNAGNGNYVGSLAGDLGGHISECYVEGGSVLGEERVGGLVGYNHAGEITNCYVNSTVEGSSVVGGLVGYNSGTIANSYSTGSVVGTTDVGGLVGDNWNIVDNSYWDTETSGLTYSAGGTGLPTEDMQNLTTFTDAGWDFVGETANGIEDSWFIPQQDYPHLWWEGMEVSMKLTPQPLNCRSQGNWVKAHLTLPEGFTVADVDPNRPAVLRYFGFESAPLNVSVNENELVEIKAAFRDEDFCSLASDWPDSLAVYGFFSDGSIFFGTSTVRIITPSLKDISELAARWLEMDCSPPDWCSGMDLNKDSVVNLVDFALIQTSEIEFVSK